MLHNHAGRRRSDAAGHAPGEGNEAGGAQQRAAAEPFAAGYHGECVNRAGDAAKHDEILLPLPREANRQGLLWELHAHGNAGQPVHSLVAEAVRQPSGEELQRGVAREYDHDGG